MASIERPNDPASRAFRRFREHGDPAAMTEVFDLVGQELFALAAHIARDAAEAEDLVQEVFLAALAGARRFDPTRAVTPWLVGILVKEARKSRRGRARREGPRAERAGARALHDSAGDATLRTAPPTEAPLAKALTGEVRLAITRALQGVPALYREVLQPVLEDGVAPTALAASLGRAPGTVRAQLHRGLELLRKALPHTLAPALVPPLVSALASELGAGCGLASIRADLAHRAALEGPGLALAGAGVLVTPSLPLLGVVVMQTKVLAAIAATAVIGLALWVERADSARPTIDPTPALVAPSMSSLVAAPSAVSESAPEPRPIARLAVAAAEPDVAAAPEVKATATLTVRVVDEDGAGVHRANVLLEPTPEEIPALRTGNGRGHTYVQGNSDRDGRVTLEVSAGRPLELRGGRLFETSQGTVLVDSLAAGARAEATIVVKTRADLDLNGRVVDAESGAPLAGVELRVEEQSGFRPSRQDRPRALPPVVEPDAVTDFDGRFRVPAKSWTTSVALFTGVGWSPRIARLHQADAPGPTDAAARVEPTEPTVVEIALLRAARIEGTVSGAPGPALVRVTLRAHGLITDERRADWTFNLYGTDYQLTADVDAAGAFTLEDVPAEADLALSLVATGTGELLLQEAQTVRIAHGATHRVAWSLGSGGRFECSVHHASGTPAPNEELWLLPFGPAHPGETEADWEPLQRTRTDAHGRASFDDVQPGPWVVALAPAKQVEDSTLRYAVRATIDAPGARVPVVFTLHAGLYISGTIVAPDGTPAQAYLSATSAAFGARPRDSGEREGQFRIGPLLPGRYLLSAHAQGWTSEGATPLTDSDLVSAEAGAEDVEVKLKAGCEFVLTAIDSATDAPAPAAFTVVPQERETAISTGDYRTSAKIGGQAPGRYRVLARSEDGLVGLVAVDIAAGERRAVSVPLSAGGRVRVAYKGPARVLTVGLEEPGARVGLVYVPSDSSETLHAPPGRYTLRLAVREFDHATQTLKTLREETRPIEITSGGEVAIDVEH